MISGARIATDLMSRRFTKFRGLFMVPKKLPAASRCVDATCDGDKRRLLPTARRARQNSGSTYLAAEAR